MKSILNILFIFSSILIIDPVHAETVGDCVEKYLSPFLGRPLSPRNAFDVSANHFDPNTEKLRRLILANPDEFDLLWQNVSKEELLEMGRLLKEGVLTLPEEQKEMFDALVAFVKSDPEDLLWVNPGQSWATLQTHRPIWRPTSSEAGLGGTIAGADTYSLTEIEKEIVQRAINQGGSRIGRGSFLRRIWTPLYHPTRNIIRYNNTMRSALDLAEETENALREVVQNASTYGLTQREIKELNTAMLKVRSHVKEIREDAFRVYKQDIFTGGVTASDELDIYKLSKRISDSKSSELQGITRAGVDASEKAMDHMNRILSNARKRKKIGARTQEHYLGPELKIRHHQRFREAREAAGRRSAVMGQDTGKDVYVSYRWNETETYITTETYTDAKGNVRTRMVTKTRVITKNGTKSESVDFDDVIRRRLQISGDSTSSPGFNGVITSVIDDYGLTRRSASAAKKENGLAGVYRSELSDLEHLFANHVSNVTRSKNEPAYARIILERVKNIRRNLKKASHQARKYSLSSDSSIKKQWADDIPTNFRSRNKSLAEALERMNRLAKIYQEQFKRRQMELVPTPEYPDFSIELAKLKSAMHLNYAGKTVVGLAGLTTAACLTLLKSRENWRGEEIPGPCKSIWNKIKGFFSKDLPAEDPNGDRFRHN